MHEPNEPIPEGIAITGMAGRFPGAESVAEFWKNLVAGLESVSTIERDRIPDTEPKDDPDYVPRRGLLKDPEWFDAAFFGMNPKEAEATDPQQRLFLEECWHALEDAGVDPVSFRGSIGVYAGMSNNSYFQSQVEFNAELRTQAGAEAVMMGNEKDYLATRVAYKLNLRGPALNIYTACSTSLVSVCQAVAGLQSFQCDVALAGGVSVKFPQERGYLYQEGSIHSPDGHCRAFDERAQGTVFGCGVGVVTLKRLEDALRAGDRIYAVIKGAALNNDGSDKVSFMAPSVNGHAEVISLAHALADIAPASIGYIECHGTATPIGDPIEIAGLAQAFRAGGAEANGFCAIGSVKTNIGHLDAAAGVTGLIKTALSLHHRVIPASLHFTRPNPALGLENSPFFVNTTTRPWEAGDAPRRAGVSSFGVGGTNAHCVLEEAPAPAASSPGREEQVLVLSAASEPALTEMQGLLADWLETQPDISLADAAWSLQTGRAHLPFRLSVVADDAAETAGRLRDADAREVCIQHARSKDMPVAFLFPGQGSQHLRMGAELKRSEPVFAEVFGRCCRLLQPLMGLDLAELLEGAPGDAAEAECRLARTQVAQPTLFAVEYALAKLLESRGIRPSAMLGHSIGEYVAACLAGVMSLEDALRLVAARGRIMAACPAGSMLAVRLGAAEVAAMLSAGLEIAAVNSPVLTVVSGPTEAIESFAGHLAKLDVQARKLVTSHAFHSAMMEPALAEFRMAFQDVRLSAPKLPYVSNVTGKWISDEDAVSPEYYVRHLRETVRFADGVAEICSSGPCVLLEVGPSQALAPLAKQHPAAGTSAGVFSLLPSAKAAGVGEFRELMKTLGRLWTTGVRVDWASLHDGERRQRVGLPLYPFQRLRFCGQTVLPPGTVRVGESSLLPAAAAPAADEESLLPSVEQTVPHPNLPGSRLEILQQELRTKLHQASGIDLAGAPGNASFFDLGFDSLFLTQAGIFLKKHFGVRITFRQLAEELATLDALARYLDAQLPPDKFQPAPAPAAATVPVSPVTGSGGSSAPVAGRLLHLEREIAALRNDLLGSGAGKKSGGWSVKAPAHAASARPPAFGPFRPLQVAKDGSLTDQQRRHLEGIIAGYTAKTAGSKAYTQRHRVHFADPRAVSGFNHLWKEAVYPIVTNRSKGVRLWDIDGNEWLDITLGFGPMLLGHSPDFVVDAVRRQLEEGFENGPTSPLAGEVAELMLEFSGMDRVGFCNTGSEAVVAALRMSRTVTGRDRVVTFAGDYHGIFDEVLMRPQVEDGQLRSAPVAPGIPEEMGANILVLEYGTQESLEIIREHGNEIAAVLVEPVRSRDPGNQPAQFLHDLREITAACGAALIFDEIVTGFRCHPQGAQGWFGIQADIATYGKVAGGGLPIGMVAGKRRFMDALDGGWWQFGDASGPEVGVTFFAGTFVRHPLALAATRAVLQFLKEKGPSLQEELNARTAALVERLNAIALTRGVPVRFDRFSSLFYPAFAPGIKYTEPFFLEMRSRGIYIWSGRPSFLSIAHTDADLERILTAFDESLGSLQAGGFLPTADGQEEPLPLPQPASRATSGRVATTPAQMEMFLAAQVSCEASTACHESMTIRLDGPLDPEALKRSLQELTVRHEALRAGFSADGATMHWVSEVDLAMPVVDLSALPDEQRRQRVEATEAEQFLRPFALDAGPLLRAVLLRLGASEHRLILTAHHLVCDGWSFGVLVEELRAVYARCTGVCSGHLPPAASFAAYAAEQAAARSAGEMAADRDYWLGRFATVPPPLALPVDRGGGAEASWDTAGTQVELPGELTGRLKDFCRERGLTPFHVLLTAWEILMHRLSASLDFVTGVPLAGQAAAGEAALCGHCVHFLPVRAQIGRDETIETLLETTRRRMLDAVSHQGFSLGELLEALPGLSAHDRMHFVRTVFSLETLPDAATVGDMVMTPLPGLKRRALADLMLFAFQRADGMGLQCTFKASLFAPETIARWLEHYQVVLDAVISRPQLPVAACPLLTEAQQRQLTVAFNDSGCPPYPESCIHELFMAEAARRPDAVAVECGDVRLTYAELEARSSRLAQFLRNRGVRRDLPVPVLMGRSPELIVVMLGILKADGAYLPIDPAYPAERIRFMLEDSGAAICLTEKDLQPLVPQGVVAILPGEWAEVGTPVQAMPSVNRPDDLAYVLYTSGSTGKPKGVPVPHRAVVRLVRNTNFATLDEHRVWLLAGALTFDATTLEIWGPLLNGGRLVVLPAEELSLEGIGAAIARNGVTSLWLTAGLFQLMVDERLEALRGVRELLTGGDVVSIAHAAKALQAFPALRLINGYGPTENTTFSACHTIVRDDLRRASLPIGRPVAHSTCHVLDAQGELCPVGVPGELHVGGDGLSRGYWNNPAMTNEKFVADRFSARPGARLYRTGDLARWLPDGTLEFLGRMDAQVKIRGFRIELQEVETALGQHPSVAQVCVVAHGSNAAEKRLVAYVQWKPGAGADAAVLRGFAAGHLPDYMVPSLIMPVAVLPVTANGKIDRSALPEPQIAGAAGTAKALTPPKTETERTLVRLWAEALGVAEHSLGLESDFFSLGGTSLMALKLLLRIREQFQTALPLGRLFHAPTLGKLARLLDAKPAGETFPTPISCLQPGSGLPPLFLIHGGDGGANFYTVLLPGLGAARPVYIIEATALTDEKVPQDLETIEETAATYVALLRTVQPQGPYLLGGYSYGGVVVYEMARQLQAAGEELGPVVLFDTENPAVALRRYGLLERVAINWRSRSDAGVAGKLLQLGSRLGGGLRQRLRTESKTSAALRLLREGVWAKDENLRRIQVRERNVASLERYVPESLEAPVLLLRSDATGDKYEFPPDYGWGRLVNNLTIETVHGGHLQIFEEPAVADMAEKVHRFLECWPAQRRGGKAHDLRRLQPAALR
ncbi:MAG: amino acid adenylation domain-containing protein [Verrucomicrobiales bacterium]|nr:amino acid adenylation domain-containing protein [Verrucomicrobiales bacterium]